MKIKWLAAFAVIAMTTSPIYSEENPPIRIAVINDQSGLYADAGGLGSVVGARIAAEEFGGEVLGRKIEIIGLDHQNKPDVAANLARKLIAVDHVDLITDWSKRPDDGSPDYAQSPYAGIRRLFSCGACHK